MLQTCRGGVRSQTFTAPRLGSRRHCSDHSLLPSSRSRMIKLLLFLPRHSAILRQALPDRVLLYLLLHVRQKPPPPSPPPRGRLCAVRGFTGVSLSLGLKGAGVLARDAAEQFCDWPRPIELAMPLTRLVKHLLLLFPPLAPPPAPRPRPCPPRPLLRYF